MVVDLEALPLPDGRDHVRLQAEVQLDHAVASRARQVMVVMVAFAEPEGMRSVRELDPIQHLHPHQLVDGSVDGGSPDARVGAAQLLEQLIRRKRRAGVSQANQVLCDGTPGPGFSFTELRKRFVDSFLDVHWAVSALSPMIIVFSRRA